MPEKWKYGFRIKYEKAWAWHIGLFFCIHPKDVNGKREVYLFFCLGRHDISIGFMADYNDPMEPIGEIE